MNNYIHNNYMRLTEGINKETLENWKQDVTQAEILSFEISRPGIGMYGTLDPGEIAELKIYRSLWDFYLWYSCPESYVLCGQRRSSYGTYFPIEFLDRLLYIHGLAYYTWDTLCESLGQLTSGIPCYIYTYKAILGNYIRAARYSASLRKWLANL